MNVDAELSSQKIAVAGLPATDPTGGANLEIDEAEQKALGFTNLGVVGTSPANPDGIIGFSSTSDFNYSPDPNQTPIIGEYDFLAVVEHEISEVMGRTLGSMIMGLTGRRVPSTPSIFSVMRRRTTASSPPETRRIFRSTAA